jgi:hypothetical protein
MKVNKRRSATSPPSCPARLTRQRAEVSLCNTTAAAHGRPIAGAAYVAVHVAFSRNRRLFCLGIHQPRVALLWRPMLKFENDSAGKRAGLFEVRLFRWKNTIARQRSKAICA